MDFLLQSWPYLVGFALEGDVALLFWLLHFAASPRWWPVILILAGTISLLSFQLYYLLGRTGHRALKRWISPEIQQKIERWSRRHPPFLLVLFMRFLYAVRNPLAVWLGFQRYPAGRFLLGNAVGDVLWLATLFMLFYFLRAGAGNMLLRYQKHLLTLYFILLGLLLFSQTIRWFRKRPTFQE
jgi:membrane protein DedA with SNARE-associated domain